MLEIGKLNKFRVTELQAASIKLDGKEWGAFFLPKSEVPATTQVGDELEVFVYWGNDKEPVLTTTKPFAEVDNVAWLKVTAITAVGAFLDWGLPKDLLVPFREQRERLSQGEYCLVKILFDEEYGIYATPKINQYLHHEAFYLTEGQAVNLLIADKSELGIKAIINDTYWGLLYQNEIFQPLRKGQRIAGYVKHIRPDDRRIDLSLYPPGYRKVEGISENILQQLRQNNGYLPLSDKSSPETIYAQFGVSKKVFKQAIGALYKQRLIVIEDTGIQLVVA